MVVEEEMAEVQCKEVDTEEGSEAKGRQELTRILEFLERTPTMGTRPILTKVDAMAPTEVVVEKVNVLL